MWLECTQNDVMCTRGLGVFTLVELGLFSGESLKLCDMNMFSV